MTIASGANTKIFILEEASYGINVDNANYKILPFKSSSLALSKTNHQSTNITGDRNVQEVKMGVKSVAGDISMDLSNQSGVELLLLGLLGDDTAASGAMTVGNVRQSYTIEQYYEGDLAGTNDVHIFKGMEVNSFSLTVPADGMVEASFGFVGKDLETADSSDAGTPDGYDATNNPYHSQEVVITEGAANSICTDLSLSIENNISTSNTIGTDAVSRGGIGLCSITGSLTAHFESGDLLEKFINNTDTAITITCGTGADGISFAMPKVRYTTGSVSVQDGLLSVTMDFVAMRDGAGAAITIDNVL